MPRTFAVSTITLLAVLAWAPVLRAQLAPEQQGQLPGVAAQLKQRKWNNSPPVKAEYLGKKKAGPAPRRDLSGIWDGTAEGGIQFLGALAHTSTLRGKDQGGHTGGEPAPDERNIINPIPYSAAGEAALKANKPGIGIRAVPAVLTNDPVNICDPQGFPRMELFELRVIELAQTKNQVLLLNEFDNAWRIIWTDGRPLPDPNDVDPRWNGYSVGKWTDDYTFVVDTVGFNDKTWLDQAGRPHSSDLRTEETFHRLDSDTLELSVKIDDPKMYTQAWMGLDKFVLHRLPDNFDIEEMICSPTETAEYNKVIGTPDALPANEKK